MGPESARWLLATLSSLNERYVIGLALPLYPSAPVFPFQLFAMWGVSWLAPEFYGWLDSPMDGYVFLIAQQGFAPPASKIFPLF